MNQKIILKAIEKIHTLIKRHTGEDYLSLDEIPRYPPFAKGLPLATTDQILETQKGLLYEIKLEVGEDSYEKHYLPCIRNYVDFVNLLPASERDHHRGAGGLFRHGLEVAKITLIYAKHEIFDSHLPPSEIHENEPKWHLATFLSGLVHDIGKPLSDYQVVTEDGTHLWNPFAENLYEWGKENGVEKYFINWQKGRYRKHESLSSVIAKNIFTDDALSFMTTPGNTIIRQMFECVTNQPDHRNAIYSLVKDADHHSTKSDIKNARVRGEDVNLSVPVEKYVVDAIKRLNVEGKWGDDFIKTSPFVFSGESLFLKAKAMKRVTEAIIDSKIPGVPWSQKELTESLINMDFAIPRETEDGNISNVWATVKKGDKKITWAIRIKDWSLIFPDRPTQSTEHLILSEEQLTQFNEKNKAFSPEKKEEKHPRTEIKNNATPPFDENESGTTESATDTKSFSPEKGEAEHTQEASHKSSQFTDKSVQSNAVSPEKTKPKESEENAQNKTKPPKDNAGQQKKSENGTAQGAGATTSSPEKNPAQPKDQPKQKTNEQLNASALQAVFASAPSKAFTRHEDGIYISWVDLDKNTQDKKESLIGELKDCFILTETSQMNHLIDGKPCLVLSPQYLSAVKDKISPEKKESGKTEKPAKQPDDPKTPPLKNHRTPRKKAKGITQTKKEQSTNSPNRTRKWTNNDSKSPKKDTGKLNNNDKKLAEELEIKLDVLSPSDDALRAIERFRKGDLDRNDLLEELKVCFKDKQFAIKRIKRVFDGSV